MTRSNPNRSSVILRWVLLIHIFLIAGGAQAALVQQQDSLQLLAALTSETMHADRVTVRAGIAVGQDEQYLYIVSVESADGLNKLQASPLNVNFPRLADADLQGEVTAKTATDPVLSLIRIDKSVHPETRQGICLKFDRLLEEGAQVERGTPVYPLGHVGSRRWIIPVQADGVLAVDDDEIVFQTGFVGNGHLGGALIDEAGYILGLIHRRDGPLGFAVRIEQIVAQLGEWQVPVALRASRYGTQSPLVAASEAWDVEEIERLVAECYEVNVAGENERTPLLYAVEQGDERIARLLLAHGAESNTADARCRIALSKAAEQNQSGMVQLLLSYGADPSWSVNCSGPFRRAVDHGNPEILGMLLAADYQDTAARTRRLKRAYFIAVKQGWIQGIGLFLDNGIGVDLRDQYRGQSALHQASEEGVLASVAYLIDRGADVNLRDNKDQTALHAAAAGSADKHLEVMQRLIAAGAELDARDQWGQTPLHTALRIGDEVLAAKLFEACADPYILDEEGRVAMELASEKRLRTLFEYMLEIGAYEKNQACPAHLRLTTQAPPSPWMPGTLD